MSTMTLLATLVHDDGLGASTQRDLWLYNRFGSPPDLTRPDLVPRLIMGLDIFRTERLHFVPIEDNKDHDDFLLRLRSGSLYANTVPQLPTPGGPEATKRELRDFLVKRCRVPLFMCLNEPEGGSAAVVSRAGNAADAQVPESGSESAASEPATTVIGILILGKPGLGDDLSVHNSNGSVGLNLLEEYTGKGYGGEALEWMLWYAFVMAGLHRLAIGATGWNKGAQRLYERLGFTVEGRSRECVWFMGGWHDMVNMGILKREWEEMRKGKERRREAEFGLGSEEVARIMGCS